RRSTRPGRRAVSFPCGEADGLDDGLDIVVRHHRVNRQRDFALELARRDRERLARVAEAVAVERMEMQRDEMHARADAARPQRLDEGGAVDAVQAQRVEMPGVI